MSKYKTMGEWIDNEGWKDETIEENLNQLNHFCLSLRKTTSYKHFSRNTMLNSNDVNERNKVYINDIAKVMQKILEHLGAKPRRMSDF